MLWFIKPILLYFSVLSGASHQKMLRYRRWLNVARERLSHSMRQCCFIKVMEIGELTYAQ